VQRLTRGGGLQLKSAWIGSVFTIASWSLIEKPFLYLCDHHSLSKAVNRWIGESGKATVRAPDVHILAAAIEILRKRIAADWKRLLHHAQKAQCTRRKKRQALRRSYNTGMRSAQSGDYVLPSAGARRCKDNHRGIEGEHRAQCARVRR